MIKFNEENILKLVGKSKKATAIVIATAVGSTFLTGCNRQLFDTKYGLDKALIYGDDTAIVFDIEKWKDYKGEQFQISTSDGLIVLTSSFDTNMIYGNSSTYSTSSLASAGISESGEVYDLSKDNTTVFNYDLIDTNWKFNKAIVFNNNNAVIIPIKQWKDYEGEQFQVITPDNLVLNLCSTNSKLVYDKESTTKAYDLASMYVGTDGEVIDLSSSYDIDHFNYDIIDTKWGFNKAIILKDNSVTILPITKWCDYEGEQLQLTIENGPVIVTAAYDTILVNDIESVIKATDIASILGTNKKITDYSEGIEYPSQIVFNGTLVDFQYGFSNGVLSNNNSASSFPIKQWCDYEGEQLQVKLNNGDIILTSSYMLDLINGGSNSINASTLAKSYIDEGGSILDTSNGDTTSSGLNKDLLDTEYKFNYALKVENGNVTIIPINKWKDFYNTDGGEDKDDSPNCEQIQIIMPDGSAMVTTSYDTALVKTNNPESIAEMFKGENGVVTNLTSYLGNPTPSGFNLTLFDTKYNFNYAILNNGSTSQVLPISKWMDYSEGEQLQLLFNDGTGILTSFVNTSLISTKDPELLDKLSNALSGVTNEDMKSRVKKY